MASHHRHSAPLRALISGAALALLLVNCHKPQTAYPPLSVAEASNIASVKLLIQWPVNSNSGAFDTKGRAEFCATLIEILEGSQLKRRALERVRGLHPELKEISVEVHAARVKDTGIIEVTIFGSEPKYIRSYLDAVMGEYVGLETELIETSPHGTAANKIIEEVITREKSLRKSQQELAAFMREHPQDFDAEPNKARHALLVSEHGRLKQEYEPWLKLFRGLDASFKADSPKVVILEKAH